MSLIVREPESNFIPAPPGLHLCVCCDVIDLGMVETQWGEKAMIRISWQTQDLMEDGTPYLISQRYTASLHEKSNLRQDLESWRGRAFTQEELAGFDLENLIGVPCQIQVAHNLGSNGKTYANVQAIVTAPKGSSLEVRDYTRKKDRDDYQPQPPTNGGDHYSSDYPDEDDPIPFFAPRNLVDPTWKDEELL